MEGFENLVYEILDTSYLPHQSSNRSHHAKQLAYLASLAEAINVLQRQRTTEEVMREETRHQREAVSKCLQCLLFIWATLQESDERSIGNQSKQENSASFALNTFLHASRHIWAKSEDEVMSLILEDFAKRRENMEKAVFVTTVIACIQGISLRALYGAEQCLSSYWN